MAQKEGELRALAEEGAGLKCRVKELEYLLDRQREEMVRAVAK